MKDYYGINEGQLALLLSITVIQEVTKNLNDAREQDEQLERVELCWWVESVQEPSWSRGGVGSKKLSRRLVLSFELELDLTIWNRVHPVWKQPYKTEIRQFLAEVLKKQLKALQPSKWKINMEHIKGNSHWFKAWPTYRKLPKILITYANKMSSWNG